MVNDVVVEVEGVVTDDVVESVVVVIFILVVKRVFLLPSLKALTDLFDVFSDNSEAKTGIMLFYFEIL